MSTIIGSDVKVMGGLTAGGSLLIYGQVLGPVETTGSVQTGKASLVQGNIKASDIFLNGKMVGDIHASGKVTLGPSSKLRGDLKARIIVIEEGAEFDGICSMEKRNTGKTTPITQANTGN